LQAQSTVGVTESDLLTSDTLPDIQFANMDAFQLVGAEDQTTATFVTRSLDGANTYLFDSAAADATVIIEGDDSRNDVFTLVRTSADEYAITDNSALFNPITIDMVNFVSGFDRLD